jgi:hypothetical protein
LVGDLTEFYVDRVVRSPAESGAPERERSMRPLPPLAAALSAEAHLLATLSPDARPPDVLGMARVMKLSTQAAKRAAAA